MLSENVQRQKDVLTYFFSLWWVISLGSWNLIQWPTLEKQLVQLYLKTIPWFSQCEYMCAGTCSNMCASAHTHTHMREPSMARAWPMSYASLWAGRGWPQTHWSGGCCWAEEALVVACSGLNPLRTQRFWFRTGWEAFRCHVSLPVTGTSHLPFLFIYESLFWQADGTPFPSKSLSTSRLSFSHFWRKWLSHIESHFKLCVQTAHQTGGSLRLEGTQSTGTRTPPSVITCIYTHSSHSRTRNPLLHAGLVGIPSSVEEKARTCLSPIPAHVTLFSRPVLVPPPAAPSCKSRKTNQTGSPASPLSSGILPKTSSSSLIYQPVILIFLF